MRRDFQLDAICHTFLCERLDLHVFTDTFSYGKVAETTFTSKRTA
jgi:hypothetical protein